MDDVLFTNIELEPDTHYFIYIGEIKAYGINQFLREVLAKKNKVNVDFLAIVPDALKEYHVKNVMVVNPLAGELGREAGKRVHCRISAGSFASLVSQAPSVIQLIKRLLKTQPAVEVYLFESLPELTLDTIPGVRIIGPDKALSRNWNNKIYQHEALKGVVPIVDFEICENFADTVETVDHLRGKWKDGIFVSLEYGGGGLNSCVVLPEETPAANKLKKALGDTGTRYLLSRYIPHQWDPTVLAVVANEQDVHIGGIADQQIEDFNKFRGSVFPSVLPPNLMTQIKAYTRAVGKRLGLTGYRGFFGCDYLIDKKNDVFFLEVNARKQGTTMEMCCTAECSLPTGSPSLPELEYWAVTENRFPPNAAEMEGNHGNVHWGTYNYKLDADILTDGSVPPPKDERTIFRDIAGSPSDREAFLVVEHIGNDCVVKAGSFLGRVVSVATNRSGVSRGLENGKRLIENTIGEVISHE